MATAREHMLADMANLFAEVGGEVVDVTIDSVPHRAIVQELDVIPGSIEESTLRRRALWLEKGKITIPKPGYVMNVNGEKWTVESADPTGILDVIALAMAV